MRISAREACVKPHLRTRSDIEYIYVPDLLYFIFKYLKYILSQKNSTQVLSLRLYFPLNL